jgi:hypothetical protein
LHIPTPDANGIDRLAAHVDHERGLVGGLVVLNTQQDVDCALRYHERLPARLWFVPYYRPGTVFPAELRQLGWYKIHPDVHRHSVDSIAGIVASVRERDPRPRGIMVHCYPWGTNLKAVISLPLVVALAETYPDLPILATHGGGYESWAFRAHTGGLPNVLYDFSVTLAYFQGADAVKPCGIYAAKRPQRLLFGSDWPFAEPGLQLEECVRVCGESGVPRDRLESLMLENSRRLWPEAFEA